MSEHLYRGMAEVSRSAPLGMVALRGDLADPRLVAALEATLGAAVPAQRAWTGGPGGRALWMSPDELLLTVPDAPAAMAALGAALGDAFVTLADVSDLRAVFIIRGVHGRDVLAKLCPVDFSDLSPGTVRRTRAAQAAALIWAEEGETLGLMCLRSVGDYTWSLLTNAARPGGEVGLYR